LCLVLLRIGIKAWKKKESINESTKTHTWQQIIPFHSNKEQPSPNAKAEIPATIQREKQEQANEFSKERIKIDQLGWTKCQNQFIINPHVKIDSNLPREFKT
jgi:hypothetical protein